MIRNHKKELQDCTLCPRACHVNRMEGLKGCCKESATIVLARAALHMWEEPCISGTEGSGAVFFSGCPMGCVFCQNAVIATGKCGKEITLERLKDIFLELQAQHANNINLVTPTHYALQIIEAVQKARKEGLRIPIVYNTGGYENVDTIRQLEGIVDIYLPDLKYRSTDLSKRYSNAEDYFEKASRAIEEMVRQVPETSFDGRGMMRKGVMVRHLVLPGQKEDSKNIVKYLYETFHDSLHISIMNQYTPMEGMKEYPELMRRVTTYEYQQVIDYALSLGVTKGYVQEGGTVSESFIPLFDETGV